MLNAQPSVSVSMNVPVRPVDPACGVAVLCPICERAIPPEHIGRKLQCRWCGYLYS